MALSAWQATIVNESGDVIPSAQIQVIDDATGLNADIFANSGGTPAANPFTATAGGFAQFYANAGTYRVIASDSGTGFSETWEDQRLGDAQARDTGTGADQVPTNGDLPTFGTAAQADTGTAPGEVPTNADLGTAAQADTGTASGEVPTNADLGTAAYLNTGTAAGEVPTNSILASKGANYGKNLIINGDFSVNQRGVTGTVSLASGEYGHDRFKAGSGGCTYTFATSAAVTTITITAGTLLQIIEGQTIEAKPIILSWEGTAQGRINIGSYGDSGEVTATSIAGADITVEFDTGTLSKTQLEFGDTATEFEYVHPADQLARCKRYFEIFDSETSFCPAAPGYYESTTKVHAFINYTEKRKPPSISLTAPSTFLTVRAGTDATPTEIITSGDTNNKTAMFIVTVAPATVGQGCILFLKATGTISIDAEL